MLRRPRPQRPRLAPPTGPLASRLAELRARLVAVAWRERLAELQPDETTPEFSPPESPADACPEIDPGPEAGPGPL